MESVLMKMVPRIPQLLGRAVLGDPLAIGTLVALGIGTAAYAVKKAVKENSEAEHPAE